MLNNYEKLKLKNLKIDNHINLFRTTFTKPTQCSKWVAIGIGSRTELGDSGNNNNNLLISNEHITQEWQLIENTYH